ncbi:MAG: nucleotidyltransferase domain-containing protein [archaeon]
MVKKKIKESNFEKSRSPVTERDIALDFAVKVQQKFAGLIRASILFGSQAKNTATPYSDIDLIIVIDDVSIAWDLELVSWYREELGKIIAADTSGRELHINTVKMSTWWNDLMHGDPVIINILRYGEALIDAGGFFNPMKALLLQGKIRSTPEAVYATLQRAPSHLARSKSAVLGSIEGVFWCMVDSAHAALITAGKLPPSPEHIADLLEQEFVSKNMLKENFVDQMRDVYNLHKSISHGQVSYLKGMDIDKWQDIGEKFLFEMTQLVDKILSANASKMQ